MEKIELENITEDSERDIEQEKNNLLRVMEQLRKCRLKTLVMCVLVLVVAFIILRLFVPSLSGTANGVVKFMLVVICIIDCIYYFYNVRGIKTEYAICCKVYLEEYVLKELLPNLTYDIEKGLYLTDSKASDLIAMKGATYSYEHMEGSYRDLAFQWADIIERKKKIYYIESQQIRTIEHREITFCGQWMIFENPIPFTSDLQIIQKGFKGIAKKRKQAWSENHDFLREIKCGSPEFQKKFHCWCTDEREAEAILTDDFIEAVFDLTTKSKRRIIIRILGSQVHIVFDIYKFVFLISTNQKEINTLFDYGWHVKFCKIPFFQTTFWRKEKLFREQYKAVLTFIDYLIERSENSVMGTKNGTESML